MIDKVRLLANLNYISGGFCDNCDSCGGLCPTCYNMKDPLCDVHEEYTKLVSVIDNYCELMKALDDGAKLFKNDNGEIVGKYEAQSIPLEIVYIREK